MFTFEYTFYPKVGDDFFIHDYEESILWFISALDKNGQILWCYQNSVKFSTKYVYRVTAPETDSLEEKYWNSYCRKDYKEIVAASRRKPRLTYIGENFDVEACCTCTEPSHYIMQSEYASYTYPVLCGDCLQVFPLYKLPKTDHGEDYFDLLDWQKVYNACDRQFMNGIGERFGYKMIHDPKSILSKEGMRFCRFWEEGLEKPFYYFLLQYYQKNKPICPVCGAHWVNDDRKKIKFDYVCKDCRVVSNDIIKK